MNKQYFQGSSLEACLHKASDELGIQEEYIKYDIVEKKSFFKKLFKICVYIEEDNNREDINGKAWVENGEIFIKDPQYGGKPCKIYSCQGVTLYFDENPIASCEGFQSNKIRYIIEEKPAQRIFNVEISPDNMEAFISINYIPKISYRIKDIEESNILHLSLEKIREEFPPRFSRNEIFNILKEYNVVYGLIEENINKCCDALEVDRLLIAKGKPVIETVDDNVELKFESFREIQFNDDCQKVNFREKVDIEVVKPGQLLLVKVEGREGKAGVDVTGKTITFSKIKRINLKAGNGCSIIGDTIVANIEGNPCYNNGVVTVNMVYNIPGDVDLSTGNIDFTGVVKITGSITEGMKVIAGGGIFVEKNAEKSIILCNGETIIKGNVINSAIEAGESDSLKQKYLDDLVTFNNNLKLLIDSVELIKQHNIVDHGKSDGEIIKLLIENKFRNIPRCYMNILKYDSLNEGSENHIVQVIKNKLMGLGPINIKCFSELYDILSIINEKISTLRENIVLPVKVQVNYVQDSKIYSSGDIVVTGKGTYLTELLARDKVIFENNNSVIIGGLIKGENEVRCKVIGSPAGVKTTISVGKKGHIWADTAHGNTKFIVGDREDILEEPARDIHAYLDEDGEIVIDKFNI